MQQRVVGIPIPTITYKIRNENKFYENKIRNENKLYENML